MVKNKIKNRESIRIHSAFNNYGLLSKTGFWWPPWNEEHLE